MANELGVYNPEFFAAEALIQLEKSLGMARRTYRQFEGERSGNGNNQGDTINIRRPSDFSVNDAPSTAQDLKTETVQVTLDFWKEVKFKLTDKELAFTGDRIIRDHIRPAAVALAEDLDARLFNLFKGVANYVDLNAVASVDVSDITDVRQALQDAEAPIFQSDQMFYGIDPRLENAFLQLTAFSQQQGAGDPGINTQVTGSLGRKYGFDIFSTQNVPTFTGGSISATAGAEVNGAVAKGDTTINIDDATALTGDLDEGDIITVTTGGVAYNYVVTADVTAAANAAAVSISPPARVAHADNDSVTFKQGAGEKQNMAFHRQAFALVMAPLPGSEMLNRLGANVAVISDPLSGLSVRSRMFYDGNASEVYVALDILYGLKVLTPDLAVRAFQA